MTPNPSRLMIIKGIGSRLGLVLCFAMGAAVAADTLTIEDCIPRYADNEGQLKELEITVSDIAPNALPDGYVNSADSPQDAATLTTYRFDSMKAGAGMVVLAAHVRGRKPVFLSFDPARQVDAKWMNERLLYIQAWWGRMVASEMVFDVLDERFLYRKLTNYGFMASPECSALQH